jgi:hypothetical protein
MMSAMTCEGDPPAVSSGAGLAARAQGSAGRQRGAPREGFRRAPVHAAPYHACCAPRDSAAARSRLTTPRAAAAARAHARRCAQLPHGLAAAQSVAARALLALVKRAAALGRQAIAWVD